MNRLWRQLGFDSRYLPINGDRTDQPAWLLSTVTAAIVFVILTSYTYLTTQTRDEKVREEVTQQVQAEVESVVHLEQPPTVMAIWLDHPERGSGISVTVHMQSLQEACQPEPVQYILLESSTRRVVAAWVRRLRVYQQSDTVWLGLDGDAVPPGSYIVSLNASPACLRRLKPSTFESTPIAVPG